MNIKYGIIGVGNRGAWMAELVARQKNSEVIYVCDLYEDRAKKTAEMLHFKTGKMPKVTCDYLDVLTDPEVRGVVVSCAWEGHVEVAVAAMRANKITAMEVGGAYSIEDCWDLVRAYEKTRVPFMFLENCCYGERELLATGLCRKDKLGEIVHCSGAYTHDLRDEITFGIKNRHYRLRNYINRNCENYPTHELGPIAKILDINRGNRILSLVSVASKAAGLKKFVKDHADELGAELSEVDFKQGDIIHTIITCAGGQTIVLKLDTTLPSIKGRELVVRGTKGLYSDPYHSVILDGDDRSIEFRENAVKYNNYLPEIWRNITDKERNEGHGGMDELMIRTFTECCATGAEMPIDVYDAATWMSVSCLSEQSIILGGAPVSMPDFTNGKWLLRKRLDVADFV